MHKKVVRNVSKLWGIQRPVFVKRSLEKVVKNVWETIMEKFREKFENLGI